MGVTWDAKGRRMSAFASRLMVTSSSPTGWRTRDVLIILKRRLIVVIAARTQPLDDELGP
jgi:hypothetical protein